MSVVFSENARDKLFFALEWEDRPADEIARFQPGSVIVGTVQVEAREEIRARSVELVLEWFTEGKGDRDGEVIDRKELASGSLRARQACGDSFQFQLPEQPWSYAGELVNIIWSLTVKIDVPMGRDLTVSQRFVVDPRG